MKYPDIEQQYDVWHVSKGKYSTRNYQHINDDFIIGVKKLAKLSQYKDCDIVGDWIKNITNHLYWLEHLHQMVMDNRCYIDRWKSLNCVNSMMTATIYP